MIFRKRTYLKELSPLPLKSNLKKLTNHWNIFNSKLWVFFWILQLLWWFNDAYMYTRGSQILHGPCTGRIRPVDMELVNLACKTLLFFLFLNHFMWQFETGLNLITLCVHTTVIKVIAVSSVPCRYMLKHMGTIMINIINFKSTKMID